MYVCDVMFVNVFQANLKNFRKESLSLKYRGREKLFKSCTHYLVLQLFIKKSPYPKSRSEIQVGSKSSPTICSCQSRHRLQRLYKDLDQWSRHLRQKEIVWQTLILKLQVTGFCPSLTKIGS